MKTKNFYVTYGCGTNLNRKFSRVEAVDSDEARTIVQGVCGTKYAFIYTEEQFLPQIERHGLSEVELQPQHHLWETEDV